MQSTCGKIAVVDLIFEIDDDDVCESNRRASVTSGPALRRSGGAGPGESVGIDVGVAERDFDQFVEACAIGHFGSGNASWSRVNLIL